MFHQLSSNHSGSRSDRLKFTGNFRLRFILLILICCVAAASCAEKGLKLKQASVLSLQVSESSLQAAQNIERSICFNSPSTESGTICTNPLAQIVGLNKQIPDNSNPVNVTVHVLLSRYFSRAFDAIIKAGNGLLLWNASGPIPSSVTDYLTIIDETLRAAKMYLPDQTLMQDKLTVAKTVVVTK